MVVPEVVVGGTVVVVPAVAVVVVVLAVVSLEGTSLGTALVVTVVGGWVVAVVTGEGAGGSAASNSIIRVTPLGANGLDADHDGASPAGRVDASTTERSRVAPPEAAPPLIGAIEAGGTKFRVAIGSGPHDIRAETTVATGGAGKTLAGVVAFLRGSGLRIAAAGVGAFGPIDLDPASASYGRLLATPKQGWSGVDLLGPIREGLGVPVAVDTDVGAAAVAEHRWGAGRGVDDLVYITVGSGIGAGLIIDGKVHHGAGHPEAGHMPVRRRPGDHFEGSCPFHGDCLEGMAAGPALEARWGAPGDDLADRDEVWELEAAYLAQAVQTLTYVVAPQRVVLGGGVMQQPGLVERIAVGVARALGGYGASPALQEGTEGYVVAAGLGQDAGLLGALALGSDVVRAGGSWRRGSRNRHTALAEDGIERGS